MESTQKVIEEIRRAFADYRRSEGCGCCEDHEEHEAAERRLAILLKAEPYQDGSGTHWSLYETI